MIRIVKMLLILIAAVILGWIGYKVVMFKLDENKEINIKMSSLKHIPAESMSRQLDCLARNVYHEAGAEPFEGKVAVAQVTLNRANSGIFPADLCKVVYQKNMVYEKVLCQFSWYCTHPNSRPPRHQEAYLESEKVAKMVLLEGFRLPSLEEAMYFHAKYVNPKWDRKRVAVIGQHIFYK
jgi:spore germination cell wall hydrolase CwlJ-like protein